MEQATGSEAFPAQPGGADCPDLESLLRVRPDGAEKLPAGQVALLGSPCGTPIPKKNVFLYGFGHVLNDLCSAAWFTYLLLFLTHIGLSPSQAALVLMCGQVADGLATLVAGRMMDAFGHLKLWHAGGSALVALSFSSIFGGCLPCFIFGTSSSAFMTASYAVFASVFNVGWACVQVSHMALVACLTAHPSSRVALNSCRNAFTMISNLGLYGLAYLAFTNMPGNNPEEVQRQFTAVALPAVAIGSAFVLVFLFTIREPSVARTQHERGCARGWKSWFGQALYYQVAAACTLTRLIANVSQAMIPFFLVRDLLMGQSAQAVVPALIFLCSFLASIILQELHWNGGRLRACFLGGCALWLLSSAGFFWLRPGWCPAIYGLAALVGTANALMLVPAVSLQAVLVGSDADGCAFVYGSLGFLDKMACGAALYAIEMFNVQPVCTVGDDSCHVSLERWVLGPLVGVWAIMAAAVVLTMRLDCEEADPELPTKRKVDEAGIREPLLGAETVGAGLH
ncbi:Major facilitator superfamily protein [Klebsormidium nitens]|uniref:Major facilitator superfamily protein n=1 Tax=Klebsormidium nitens TaxID=105231 RepID=A0A1Y1I244_KLENI|nr:Major facilitator superfamily protein [Klebsormidium nitens]|eukprot:GAQ84995.1 Major facilitator superfamily protein [Klebsormidium nitens]